jgi:hypothetical protein
VERLQEARCAPSEPPKQAQLLKNQRPGKQRKEKQNEQNGPRYPARLLNQITQLARV